MVDWLEQPYAQIIINLHRNDAIASVCLLVLIVWGIWEAGAKHGRKKAWRAFVSIVPNAQAHVMEHAVTMQKKKPKTPLTGKRAAKRR